MFTLYSTFEFSKTNMSNASFVKRIILLLFLYNNVINGVNGLNEIFKLENINLEYNTNNFVIWNDTSNNGNNTHVNISSEYLGINDNINGYCVSSKDIQKIYVPINIKPEMHPNLTMIAWVYQTNKTLSRFQMILSNMHFQYDRGLYPHATYFGSDGRVAAGVGYVYTSSIGQLTLNEWTFIAVVYTNTGSASIYIGPSGDEILREQTVSYNFFGDGWEFFSLNGRPNLRGFVFGGCIAQVEIYSNALSYSDINERFDAMKTGLTTSPTNTPTIATDTPSNIPSKYPTIFPTMEPTETPSQSPTMEPTEIPSNSPTNSTQIPTNTPSNNPTKYPTESPSNSPSIDPTYNPTLYPTIVPTKSPTNTPTDIPSNAPTQTPSNYPTKIPSFNPTKLPSSTPTNIPTHNPTNALIIPIQDTKSQTTLIRMYNYVCVYVPQNVFNYIPKYNIFI